jgi:rhamnopyranosyl-N-acetylglucosaminyl-diphospho-decaprenol beta-1,3/1,4-galactofuranosyltransferase
MGMNTSTTEKVIAVVVTYNRKKLLGTCLDGILRQTRPVDKIIIIDNNSTDDTSSFLQEKGYLNRPEIRYVKLAENTGASGGFYTGIQRAQQENTDWIWLLDDDIQPQPTCLAEQLKHAPLSQCIHPRRSDQKGVDIIWEPLFNPATGLATHLDNRSFANGKEIAFVNAGCFEGMLIHANIVRKIGLPDPRFFIINDDTLYGFIASLYTNVIVVKKARITRLLPLNTQVTGKRAYFYVRNQFLIRERLKKERLFKGMFDIFLLQTIVYQALVPSLLYRDLTTPLWVLHGVRDGLCNRFGYR